MYDNVHVFCDLFVPKYRPKKGSVLDTNIITGFKDAILTGPKKVDIDFTVRSEARAEAISSEWKRADAVLSTFE